MRQSYIYFMQVGDGPIKIGIAYNLHTRLNVAQTFNYQKVQYISHFPGNYKIEKLLHKKFEKHHIRGEWFESHPEIVNQAKGIYDIQYETGNGHNYLILHRDFIDSPTELCPFCFGSHTHGEGDGHRITHCLPYYGFSTIYSADGTPISRDSGYIIKTKSNQRIGRTPRRENKASAIRIENHHKLIKIAINQAIQEYVITREGTFLAPQGKRATVWHNSSGNLCKALYSDLGFNEVGVTILYGLNDDNWSPTTFPDSRDNVKCDAWASGIYNFKMGEVNFNPEHESLRLYISKNTII